MRVLIVEDERRLAENVARSLRESAGYAVDLAFDGEEGLFMSGTNPYDLIILDLMLPKMDGQTVLHKIRLSGSGVPVLGADRARRERVGGQAAERRRR